MVALHLLYYILLSKIRQYPTLGLKRAYIDKNGSNGVMLGHMHRIQETGMKEGLFSDIQVNDELVLTEFRPTDAPRLLEIAKTPGFHYSGLNGYAGMRVEDNMHAYLHSEAIAAQTAMPRRTFYMAVRDTETESVIGAVEFMGGEHERNGQAELAYFTAPEHQGRGVVTKAVCIAISHALDALDLQPFWSEADPANIPSQRVLEKFGYQRTDNANLGWGGIVGADGVLRPYAGDRIQYTVTEARLRSHLGTVATQSGVRGALHPGTRKLLT
jgi:RimJ/RimL family protein N-acetyltransferase